jgi:hypothetical protein
MFIEIQTPQGKTTIQAVSIMSIDQTDAGCNINIQGTPEGCGYNLTGSNGDYLKIQWAWRSALLFMVINPTEINPTPIPIFKAY